MIFDFNYLRRYILYLSLTGYPIINFFPIIFDWNTSIINIGFRSVVLLASLIIIIFDKNSFKISHSTLFIVIFLIAYLFRLVYDLHYSDILAYNDDGYFYSMLLFANIFPLFALGSAQKPYVNIKEFLVVSRIAIILIMVLIINQYGFNIDLLSSRNRISSEYVGGISPLAFARFGGLLLVLEIFANKSKDTYKFLFILLSFVIIILSASRGPLISVFLVPVFMYLLVDRKLSL